MKDMDVFTAIAEPTRRDILEMLANQGSLPSSAIAKSFDSTPSAVSQHLKVLREARLIRVEKKAQQRIYSLDPYVINDIEEWLENLKGVWNERLDRLDKVLKDKEVKHGKNK